jgi:hypothetical protein
MQSELTAASLKRQEEHLHAMCDRLEVVVEDLQEALAYLSPPSRPKLELVESKERDDG